MGITKSIQGQEANKSGKIGEKSLIPTFQERGFELYSESEVLKHPELIANKSRYVLTNVGYTSIYGSTRSRSEYVVVCGKRRIRIEVKLQLANGSVDEKYPYLLLNAIQQYPEKEIILLIDGGGYKAGARKWVELQIQNNWLDFKGHGKDIKLMSIMEFVQYFTKEFK